MERFRFHVILQYFCSPCQDVVGKRDRAQNGLRALNSGVTLPVRAGSVTAWSGSASPAVLGRTRFIVAFRKADTGGYCCCCSSCSTIVPSLKADVEKVVRTQSRESQDRIKVKKRAKKSKLIYTFQKAELKLLVRFSEKFTTMDKLITFSRGCRVFTLQDNSHPAIIRPETFRLVQDELERRKDSRVSGYSIFSGKIYCGECGQIYGRKIWHGNDSYRKVVWQCNDKFKGSKCTTPTLMKMMCMWP